MKVEKKDPPRTYRAGQAEPVTISDCARIALEPDEQVTFVTESGGEYDLTRKDWGFYATPSTNGRLRDFGLRAVLIRNLAGRYYVLLVERGKEAQFERYHTIEGFTLVCWLDDDAALERLAAGVGRGTGSAA